MVGTLVVGTFTRQHNGPVSGQSEFIGEAIRTPMMPPDPTNSLITVRLLQGISYPQASGPGGCKSCTPMNLYLNCTDGTITRMMAYSSINRRAFEINTSSITVTPTRFAGAIGITVPVDQAIGFPENTMDAVYTFDAKIRDGVISGTHSGTHSGTFDESEVGGYVYGRCFDKEQFPNHQNRISELTTSRFSGSIPADTSLAGLAREEALNPVIADDRYTQVFWNDFRYNYDGLAGKLTRGARRDCNG